MHLWVAEQESETKDSHIKCLRAITEQVFPKDKSNDKKRKAKSKKNDSNVPAPK
jgi:hypothetical protein